MMKRTWWISGIGIVAVVGLVLGLYILEWHIDASADQQKHSSKRTYVREGGAKRPEDPDRFFEYHRRIRTRLDDLQTYRPGYRLRALRQSLTVGKAVQQHLDWVERGPGNIGGRTRGLVVDPEDPTGRTWYAGSASGGVWKTEDAGHTWRNMTPELPNLATVALAQPASEPDVLYAGTGEGFGNNGAVNGDGVWRSTDRGETWTQLASTANNADFQAVNRLLVDPNDAEVVIAATNAGLFRTTDGGQTWTTVLARPVEDDGSSLAGAFQQVVASPDDFDHLYAASNGVGVFKSTDAGQTWHQTLDIAERGQRLELAIAPSDPERMYAAVQHYPNAALYMSGDGGERWTLVEEQSGTGPNWFGGQGWYNNTIAVNPYNSRIVYVGGIDVWRIRIRDGQRITTQLTSWNPELNPATSLPYVHADHHNLTIVPTDRQTAAFRIIDANDGGVAYSDDGGTTWHDASHGYNTTQFYGADKRSGADEYVGGMQDNGTWRSPDGASSHGQTAWVEQFGGDGFDAVWHAEDPQQIIAGWQFNNLLRTTDGGETWTSATEDLDDSGQGQAFFFNVIAQSESDPDLLFTTGPSGIWRSDNFGAHWTLSSMVDGEAWMKNVARAPAAISLADPQIVWAGGAMSHERSLFVSTDGGVTFEVVPSSEGISAQVTGLATHPTDSATAYALFSTPGDPKVLRTRDLGQTWANLTGTFTEGQALSSNGFPDVVTYSLVVMPHDPDELWVGTEIGLFVSEDGGATWARAENGLPAVSVWQMRIVDDQVVAATHGRGLWSVTLPELANHTPPEVVRAPRLNEAALSPTQGLTFDLSLRSAYDSLHVVVDSLAVKRLAYETTVQDTLIALPAGVTEPRVAQVGVTAYREGRAYPSARVPVTLHPVADLRASYTNDFNAPSDDFFGDAFTVQTAPGFDDGALHSPHPYGDRQTLTHQLRVPIQVGGSQTILRYEDVALVEPGKEGTQFGDENFWDYVVVEGSKDGANWEPLLTPYDARADARWVDAYEDERDGTAELFVAHEIDLLDTFAPGDVIFIRFRLFADAAFDTHGWGWAIDNLSIQEGLQVAQEATPELPSRYVLGQNYPNPFNAATRIPFTAPRTGHVTLDVYDLRGRRVATLVDEVVPAGSHEVRWAADHLASGLYVYRLNADDVHLSRSLTVVR